MVLRHIVERVIYVAQCNCNPNDPWRSVKVDNPPRESLCPYCKTWIPYKEESAQSEEYKGKQ